LITFFENAKKRSVCDSPDHSTAAPCANRLNSAAASAAIRKRPPVSVQRSGAHDAQWLRGKTGGKESGGEAGAAVGEAAEKGGGAKTAEAVRAEEAGAEGGVKKEDGKTDFRPCVGSPCDRLRA